MYKYDLDLTAKEIDEKTLVADQVDVFLITCLQETIWVANSEKHHVFSVVLGPPTRVFHDLYHDAIHAAKI